MTLPHKYTVVLLFSLSIIINIITCLVLWYYISPALPELPIHYNVISGFDEIGSRSHLYQLPIFGFIVAALNMLLIKLLGKTGEFVSIISGSAALLVSMVVLLAAVLLVIQS